MLKEIKKNLKSKTNRSEYYKQRRIKKDKNGLCIYCSSKQLKNIKYCEKCWYKKAARDLDIDWLDLKIKAQEQNYKCPYTNMPISPGCNMSLDHIKPKSRFPKLINDINNLEWIHSTVNIAKNKLTKEEFVDFVRLIYHETS